MLCAAAIAALVVAARAQDDGPSPNASERDWIAACVKQSKDLEATYRECVGAVTGACLGLEDAPKSIRPSDPNGHPRSCALVEEKLWDDLLNRWYGEATKKAPAAARDKLKAAQRAWIAYRDARCEVENHLHSFPLGADNRATCAMEETARRALELRAIANDSHDE
jgi:uncharacterized protein YecT (DUF1311 family)